MSFREKSLWVSLLITSVIAFMYGDTAYAILFVNADIEPQFVVGFITRVVIAFVVLEIVLHIALAMDDQEGAEDPEDERAKSYRLQANDVGYWVLSIGVISCIFQQMANATFDPVSQGGYGAFTVAPIELKLAIIFWLSEFTRFATELYLYNKER